MCNHGERGFLCETGAAGFRKEPPGEFARLSFALPEAASPNEISLLTPLNDPHTEALQEPRANVRRKSGPGSATRQWAAICARRVGIGIELVIQIFTDLLGGNSTSRSVWSVGICMF